MKEAPTRTKGAAECLPIVAPIGTNLACLRAREADAITGLQLRKATEAMPFFALLQTAAFNSQSDPTRSAARVSH